MIYKKVMVTKKAEKLLGVGDSLKNLTISILSNSSAVNSVALKFFYIKEKTPKVADLSELQGEDSLMQGWNNFKSNCIVVTKNEIVKAFLTQQVVFEDSNSQQLYFDFSKQKPNDYNIKLKEKGKVFINDLRIQNISQVAEIYRDLNIFVLIVKKRQHLMRNRCSL